MTFRLTHNLCSIFRRGVCVSSPKFAFRNLEKTYILKNASMSGYVINVVPNRWYSSDNKTDLGQDGKQKLEATAEDTSSKRNQRVLLKQAIRDYGSTIVVFHVAISLASLGTSYLAISNGMDAVQVLTFIGFSENVISSKVAVEGSTFVIAYAVHKVFAPVRIAITLSVAPFIVRYLRRINWLKPPRPKT